MTQQENALKEDFPLAYLITIRSFGTWLHGDENASVDRHGFNAYGAPRRPLNPRLLEVMDQNMVTPSVVFDRQQCKIIEQAIRKFAHFAPINYLPLTCGPITRMLLFQHIADLSQSPMRSRAIQPGN